MGRKLSLSRTKKLTEALNTLPVEIQYLRVPILSIAQQDQDLLGCGECDWSVFEAAWKQRAAGLDNSDASDLAIAHNQALQDWAANAGDQSSVWLGPVWFLIGLSFGPAFSQVPPTNPVVIPDLNAKLLVDIPPNLDFQDIGDGISLRDNVVSILAFPVSEADFDSLKNDMVSRASMSSAECVKESLLREGHSHACDDAFRLQRVSGVRYLEIVESSKKVFAARYFLSVPGGHAQVLLNSLTDDGLDIETYNSLIDSIHVVPTDLDG